MHRIRISLALLPLALALSLYAQDAAPAATDDQPVLTIKRSSHLVVLDVVVTDSKQNPISGLQPSDFTILEKGKPQTILNFDEHEPQPQAALPPMPNLPPNTFTNYTPVAENGPLNVFLLDSLNTRITDMSTVRAEILKFLDAMPPGTRIAIFGLSTQLRLLQGFTSDPGLLHAALKDDKNRSKDSKQQPIIPNGGQTVNGAAQTGGPATNLVYTIAPKDPTFQETSNLHEADLQASIRTQYTLDGFNALAHYLSGFPGRKNLLWFSGSFPLNVAPTLNGLLHPIANSFALEYRETIDLLIQGQVAVYPMDARGMTGQLQHIGMDEMGESTGGKAFYGTNDLAGAMQRSLSLGSHYYTITYTPPDGRWDGELRDINVKVDQPDLQLYFRHGYYADDPDKPLASGTVAVAPPSAMGTAMLYGAPEPSQIVFAAQIASVSLTPDPATAHGNNPNPKVHGPYLEYAVHYGIDPRNIVPQITPDGVHHGRLELSALLYDTDGTLVNSMSDTATVIIDDKILQQGLHITQNLSVPVDPKRQHGYTFRIGVHDVNGDRVGALEVPVAAIHDPAAAAAPAKQ